VGSFFRLFPLLLVAGVLRADPALDAAVGLYQAKQYPAAQAALEKITATSAPNAAACYYLGMTLRHRGDDQALDDAVVWLEKAVALAPANAAYLGDYGGTCLQLADRHHSFTLATRGRNAMEKAIALDPADLEARSGLMQFYARAPWPLGSKARALNQADAIAQRDAARGVRAYLSLGRSYTKSGERADARVAYAAVLTLDPNNAEAKAALAGPP
jgi:tetratricopeptide (TPR) repeat protein